MHVSKSVLEIETRRFLWDSEIQIDHLVPTKKSELMIISKKKRTYRIVGFIVPRDYSVKIKDIKKS